MIRIALPALVLVAALSFVAHAGEGQGPGDTSKSTLSQVDLGQFWYGKEIELGDLEGKVVLMEIWGS